MKCYLCQNLTFSQPAGITITVLHSMHLILTSSQYTRQAWRKQNCIGLAYWYQLVPECDRYVHAEARGVWGHAPPGKFFEFDAVRWLLRL